MPALSAQLGIGPGDRVTGYLVNGPKTVIAFLACASIGAIWSACSPDFGVSLALGIAWGRSSLAC